MEIDVKKNNNKEFDFLSVESSNSFDVNKLRGVSNVGSTHLLNNSNNNLIKKSETELKQYFSKNKEELIKILKEILEVNKNDFKKENEQLLKSLVSEELDRIFSIDENRYIITYEGDVTELPENPGTGKIYGLISENNKITYYMFLNDKYVILLDKTYFDESYYKKNVINSKIIELDTQLNKILLKLESTINNSISKTELYDFLSKLNSIKNDVNGIKSFLNI